MIESTSNAGVKLVIGLNQKSRNRKKENAFVVEGPRMVFETPVSLLKRVYYEIDCPLGDKEKARLEEFSQKGIFVETVSPKVMKAMADTVTPQGILAVVEKPSYRLEDLMDCESHNPMILVMETIQDPGNLGTMFRTAEGAGCSGILMSKDTVDVFSPKAVRSTMGSLYRMPFYIADSLQETILKLKDDGICFFAAALDGKKSYDEFDFSGPCGFLIGNEGNGLTKEAIELADEKLIIPMGGQLESLNAAMAAGILMYEGARQRRVSR